MTASETRDAYSQVADQYISLLGRMEMVDPADCAFIRTAFQGVTGTIVDAGCGPGHLTAFLTREGHHAVGVDAVPRFIEHARQTHPGIPFSLGNIQRLDHQTGSLGGILAWYSLIHMSDGEFSATLDQFHRVLAPGGVLVLGLVPAETLTTFDHRVTPATAWPVTEVLARLERAGFTPLRHETRPATERLRAHLAVSAVSHQER